MADNYVHLSFNSLRWLHFFSTQLIHDCYKLAVIIAFTELEFPSSLTSTERAYIHKLCGSLGLKTKSKGYVLYSIICARFL